MMYIDQLGFVVQLVTTPRELRGTQGECKHCIYFNANGSPPYTKCTWINRGPVGPQACTSTLHYERVDSE